MRASLEAAPWRRTGRNARGAGPLPADGGRPPVFRLHPGAWRFAAGRVARLELLGRDAPYGRASNGTFTVDVRSLELRVLVRERRGAQVRRPLAPVAGR
jgi:hypothetical protein